MAASANSLPGQEGAGRADQGAVNGAGARNALSDMHGLLEMPSARNVRALVRVHDCEESMQLSAVGRGVDVLDVRVESDPVLAVSAFMQWRRSGAKRCVLRSRKFAVCRVLAPTPSCASDGKQTEIHFIFVGRGSAHAVNRLLTCTRPSRQTSQRRPLRLERSRLPERVRSLLYLHVLCTQLGHCNRLEGVTSTNVYGLCEPPRLSWATQTSNGPASTVFLGADPLADCGARHMKRKVFSQEIPPPCYSPRIGTAAAHQEDSLESFEFMRG